MRIGERLSRGRALSLRLGVLALARAPSRTVVSCAFIAVALGLALFAAAYRATLARGAADQAAFQVPLDYSVSEGTQARAAARRRTAQRVRRPATGGRAYPVVRVSATTPGAGAAVLSPTVLGVPAGAIRQLRWRSDYSSLSRDEIARKLSAAGEPRPGGRDARARRASLCRSGPVCAGPPSSHASIIVDDRGRISRRQAGPGSLKPATLTARFTNRRPVQRARARARASRDRGVHARARRGRGRGRGRARPAT